MPKLKFTLFAIISYFLRMRFFDYLVVNYVSKKIKPLLITADSKVNVAILDVERFRDEIGALKNNNKWFLMNDDEISEFDIETNKNRIFTNAYILLYKKKK